MPQVHVNLNDVRILLREYIRKDSKVGLFIEDLVTRGQITLGATTGTPPLVISSTSLVENLNADMLDGYHASEFVRVSDTISGIVNEAIDDRVGELLQDTSAITWTYDDDNATLTPSVTHAGLEGLGADDHTQYARVDGARNFSENQTFDKNITVTQKAIVTAFQMPTGGAAGRVLTSDSSGNASWSAGVVSSHGALTGLSADDHTQYSRTDGTRAITGTQTFNAGIAVTGQAQVGTFRMSTGAVNGYVLATDASGNGTWTAIASDHGTLTGLADDDHAQYLNINGRSGGQTINGGIAASEDLILRSTGHATKGKIYIGADSFYDESTSQLGINRTPAYTLDVLGPVRVSRLIIPSGAADSHVLTSDSLGEATWRTAAAALSGNITHGDMAGLTDDDHPQYVLVDGTRNITGSQTFEQSVYVQASGVVSGDIRSTGGDVYATNGIFPTLVQTNRVLPATYGTDLSINTQIIASDVPFGSTGTPGNIVIQPGFDGPSPQRTTTITLYGVNSSSTENGGMLIQGGSPNGPFSTPGGHLRILAGTGGPGGDIIISGGMGGNTIGTESGGDLYLAGGHGDSSQHGDIFFKRGPVSVGYWDSNGLNVVSAGGDAELILEDTNAGSGDESVIFKKSGTSYWTVTNRTSVTPNYTLNFGSNSTSNVLSLTQAGRVGVQKINPDYTLHVVGSGYVTGVMRAGSYFQAPEGSIGSPGIQGSTSGTGFRINQTAKVDVNSVQVAEFTSDGIEASGVLVGTESKVASAALTVSQLSAPQVVIKDPSGSNATRMDFYGGATQLVTLVATQGGGNPQYFRINTGLTGTPRNISLVAQGTSDGEGLVVTPSGVAIQREDTPQALSINGSILASGLLLPLGAQGGYVLTAQGDGTTYWSDPGAANIAIGSAVTGGSDQSVLFVNASGTLAQMAGFTFHPDSGALLVPAFVDVGGAIRSSYNGESPSPTFVGGSSLTNGFTFPNSNKIGVITDGTETARFTDSTLSLSGTLTLNEGAVLNYDSGILTLITSINGSPVVSLQNNGVMNLQGNGTFYAGAVGGGLQIVSTLSDNWYVTEGGPAFDQMALRHGTITHKDVLIDRYATISASGFVMAPPAPVPSGYVLTTRDSNGTAYWAPVGGTLSIGSPISGGVSNRVLYEVENVFTFEPELGHSANFTFDGSVMAAPTVRGTDAVHAGTSVAGNPGSLAVYNNNGTDFFGAEGAEGAPEYVFGPSGNVLFPGYVFVSTHEAWTNQTGFYAEDDATVGVSIQGSHAGRFNIGGNLEIQSITVGGTIDPIDGSVAILNSAGATVATLAGGGSSPGAGVLEINDNAGGTKFTVQTTSGGQATLFDSGGSDTILLDGNAGAISATSYVKANELNVSTESVGTIDQYILFDQLGSSQHRIRVKRYADIGLTNIQGLYFGQADESHFVKTTAYGTGINHHSPRAPIHVTGSGIVSGNFFVGGNLNVTGDVIGMDEASFRGNVTASGMLAPIWVDVPIAAAGMKGTATLGAGDANRLPESSTLNGVDYDYMTFPSGVTRSAYFHFTMPMGWDESPLSYHVTWVSPSGVAAVGSVQWSLQAAGFGDGESFLSGTSYGTAVNVVDNALGQQTVMITNQSQGVTPSNNPQAGDLVAWKVSRVGGSDTHIGDARLVELTLRYRRNRITDDGYPDQQPPE